MKKTHYIITIDGPAGSGKSTVAAGLARRLRIAYLDTGAMYRAATLAALDGGIDLDDGEALERCLRQCRIRLAEPEDPDRVWLDDRDVTVEIRGERVTANAYKIAQRANLRRLLVRQQQRLAERLGSFVTEGRDQGSVVFPEAPFKFYLDADPACRARRRWRQRQADDEPLEYEEVLRAQNRRDRRDRTRAAGPLQMAVDAVRIDTTDLTVEQVIETLYRHIKDDPKNNIDLGGGARDSAAGTT
ncbi:MAG: (d)CMP kinase [Sedimentisphaerales bacterium]|nr:(d)CMP kinase [Sedimentisphaerales bacterium]